MKKIMFVLLMSIMAINAFSQGELMSFAIKADGENINIGPYGAPVFYDLDKDGKNDLIVGEFRGKIRFYKNIGSKQKPVFKEFSYLKADGQEIVVPNY